MLKKRFVRKQRLAVDQGFANALSANYLFGWMVLALS
jgi:hypothetical protein